MLCTTVTLLYHLHQVKCTSYDSTGLLRQVWLYKIRRGRILTCWSSAPLPALHYLWQDILFLVKGKHLTLRMVNRPLHSCFLLLCQRRICSRRVSSGNWGIKDHQKKSRTVLQRLQADSQDVQWLRNGLGTKDQSLRKVHTQSYLLAISSYFRGEELEFLAILSEDERQVTLTASIILDTTRERINISMLRITMPAAYRTLALV